MKKIFVLIVFIIGIASSSFSQSAGKGNAERSNSKRKPRGQMFHFEKRKKDPNLKHNGTSFRRNRKNRYKVDGDGFSAPGQKKRKRGKKTGIN